jgi:hypothetical protein
LDERERGEEMRASERIKEIASWMAENPGESVSCFDAEFLLFEIRRKDFALQWIVNQSQFIFAECELAEEIMGRAKKALGDVDA